MRTRQITNFDGTLLTIQVWHSLSYIDYIGHSLIKSKWDSLIYVIHSLLETLFCFFTLNRTIVSGRGLTMGAYRTTIQKIWETYAHCERYKYGIYQFSRRSIIFWLTDPTDFPHPFFSYQSMWELSGYPYQGIFQTYSGGGYVAELGTTLSEAQSVLKFLKDNYWIDKQTRAVFIEANIFNPNMNLWGISLYLCEFLRTGGKTWSWKYFTPLFETKFNYFMYSICYNLRNIFKCTFFFCEQLYYNTINALPFSYWTISQNACLSAWPLH